MINLLPALIKDQLRYARLNTRAIKVFWLLIFSLLITGGAFGGAIYYLTGRISQTDSKLAEQQSQINSYKAIEEQVSALNARLASIKTLQTNQTKFSSLLTDLAAVTPRGVLINSIALTGDEKKPVRISFTAPSYNAAVAFREALASSKRIQGADLENIGGAGPVSATVVISFKSGQAK